VRAAAARPPRNTPVSMTQANWELLLIPNHDYCRIAPLESKRERARTPGRVHCVRESAAVWASGGAEVPCAPAAQGNSPQPEAARSRCLMHAA
jgi:hypothetical protein